MLNEKTHSICKEKPHVIDGRFAMDDTADMPSTKHYRLLLPLLMLVTLLLVHEWRVMPDNNLHAFFLDVGQGDAIFLRGPQGQQILLDGGPDASVLEQMGKHMSFFDRSIDVMILSHPHLDHLAGIVDVLKRYRVDLILLPDAPSNIPRFREFLALIEEKNIPVLLADPSRDLDLGGGFWLDILWAPEAGTSSDTANEACAIVKTTFGSDSILFTGDIAEEEETTILAAGADVSATILKVAHHGSRYGTSTGFLLEVSPQIAVISAGKNTFGHPHPAILNRLRHFGIAHRSTVEEGTVEMVLGKSR